ncbi:hypothetical protein CTAYLR_000443 [Chrysophaeum taylorii]|uniref:EF-hand domain-containing protein n=1 Tax=Chrysophaeum taylorii TaxID=2483200 RepID=A0AAD7UG29_9STRA|nr:hypothetical protein CTAYLR_000443 [Chrysophaeum taylorii]
MTTERKPPPPQLSGDLSSWLGRVNRLISRLTDDENSPSPPCQKRALPPLGLASDVEVRSSSSSVNDTPRERADSIECSRELENAVPRVPKPSAERTVDTSSALAYYAGEMGRERFFAIAKSMGRRPADRERIKGWLTEDANKVEEVPSSPSSTRRVDIVPAISTVEGAAARKYLEGLEEASLPPRPILNQTDAETKRLNLSSLGMGDKFGKALAQGLMQLRNFESMSLADNNLTDDSLPGLLKAATAMTELKFLDLSYNDIDEASATALRRLVADQACNLETLKLKHADVDDNDCRLLCEAIASNPKCRLKVLDLSENLVGVAEGRNTIYPDFVTGGEALADVIEAECPNSLEELKLSWNYVRGESALAIARALASNSHIRVIDLNHNAFGDLASQELGRALGKNKTLEVLKLSNNSVSSRATFVLAHCLRRATDSKFRRLELDGNSPGRKGARAVLHAVRDREGALEVTMRNCTFTSNKEQDNFFDASKPEGKYDLDMTSPYDRVVAQELLRIATIRTGCWFAYLGHAAPDPPGRDPPAERAYREIKLARKEVSAEEDRAELWRPILKHICEEKSLPREDLLRVLKTCRLNCSLATIDRISGFVDGRLASFFETECLLRGEIARTNATSRRRRMTIDAATGDVEVDELRLDDDDDDDETTPGGVMLGERQEEEDSIAAKRLKAAAAAVRVGSAMAKVIAKSKLSAKASYNRTGHHDKIVVDGGGKITYEVVLALIFRGAFRVVDQDNSGKIDSDEIVQCGSFLGLEIDREEADRIIIEFDDGDGLLSESEFVSYMLSLFLLPPNRTLGPLLNGNELWSPPDAGFLRVAFEADPSVPSLDEIGTDEGVEGLLRIIASAPTDSERAIMFEIAMDRGANGGYYTAAQAQRVIDLCSHSARLDVYDMCRRLSETMASPADCCHILGANLSPSQGVALWCELGPAGFRWCVGNLTGAYAMDLSVPRDRRDLLRLAASVHAERVKAKNARRPDTSQRGNWSGGFRNVRINGREIPNFDPLDSISSLPKAGIFTCDVVSLTRPYRTEKPISSLRFASLLRALRASEWKEAAKITASEAAAERRARASVLAPTALQGSSSTSSISRSNKDDASSSSDAPEAADALRGTTAIASSGRRSPGAIAKQVSAVVASRRGQLAAASAGAGGTSKRGGGTGDYVPLWPTRRGHRLLSVENVISYYSQLRETSNPEGFFDPSRPVRYNRISMGSGVGRILDDRDARSLPSARALSWIHLCLVELEFRTSRLLFSAQQVFALWNHLPTGSAWADVRVQLVCLLFRRTVDIENLPTVLFPNIAIEDLCQVRHRLGALNLLSPRSPEGFHRYRLHLHDEREAIRILVELAFKEPGENWVDARYRRSHAWAGNDWMPGWSLPTTWGNHVVEDGTVELCYISPVPDWPCRDRLMANVLCGAALLVESKLRLTAQGTILRR